MAVTFTSARALLAIQATALSVEATRAGLSSLATALTNLSTEITNNSSITESEFFGGGSTSFSATGGSGGATPGGGSASGSGTDKDSAAVAWSNMLSSAASIISASNMNLLRDSFVPVDSTKFWENMSGIAVDINNISNVLTASGAMKLADSVASIADDVGNITELASSTGIRTVGPFELVSFVTSYRRLIEEGTILKWREADTLSEKNISKSLNDLGKYLEKIRQNIPRDF